MLLFLTRIFNACRLFPVIPVIFRTALTDDNFKGYHIPKGTVVGLHLGALHR